MQLPEKPIDKSQAYFWTKKWQDAEKEADNDIHTSRVKVFDTVEDLLKDLER